MRLDNIKIGQIVKGNRHAGLARSDVGVVTSVSLNPPRSVKVKFLRRGYWLICPNELCEPLDNEIQFITKEFADEALNGYKAKPPREELILLLGEALNHIDDNDLNNRINDAIVRHGI